MLKAGDAATVSMAGVDQSFPGKVQLVSPALDPNSTTVEVWVELKNPKERLRPGSSVQVTMVARTLPDALSIPSVALLTTQDGTTSVMVAGADGKAHQQPIKAGLRDGDRVQIVEGLQAGQRIVGAGAYGLPDNSKITEAPASQESKDQSSGG